MSSYRRGSDAERKVKEELSAAGYYVVRAAGSHGVADLVALRGPSEVLLVQVKRQCRLDPEPWNQLYLTAEAVGALAILATCESRKGIAYARLTGTRVPFKRWLPAEGWLPKIPDANPEIEG